MTTAQALPYHSITVQDRVISLAVPRVMGILNLTPDSFYTQSRQKSLTETLQTADKRVAEGADFLDLGAVSTRPGAAEVTQEEELDRLLPTLIAVRKQHPRLPLSVDTFRAEVARQALVEGADIINDVTGGTDPAMYAVVAAANAPYILMHMRGTPQTMSGQTEYEHLLLDIQHYFLARIAAARAAGVGDIILDPGLGFAKTIPQNFEILRNLEAFHAIGCPLLIGLSRKSMIWKSLSITPDEALNGTTALHMAVLDQGAAILRVHDVRPAVEVIRLHALLRGKHH